MRVDRASCVAGPAKTTSSHGRDPHKRDADVGRRVLETGERWADTNGLTVIRLRSNSVRSNAHRVYERHGYSVEKTLHTFVKQVNESGSGGIV
jgi:hypothetical protein